MAHSSRKFYPKVTNENVQKSVAPLKDSDRRRATDVSAWLDAQQKPCLPVLPTTTIGFFPQTMDLRRVHCDFKAMKVSKDDYDKAIKEEINEAVIIQEEFDIDVLEHGEPKRKDWVLWGAIIRFCFHFQWAGSILWTPLCLATYHI